MVITERHILLAKLANACSATVKKIKSGLKFEDLSCSELSWFQSHYPEEAKKISPQMPLEFLSGYGSGYGDGYGSGY